MIRFLHLSLGCALAHASWLLAADWEELPPLPEPNGGALCGVVDSRIVVVGGTNWEGETKHWLTTVREYDPVQRVWTRRADLPSGPVAYGVAIQSSAAFCFIGGSDGKKALRNLTTVDAGGLHLVNVPALPPTLVLAAGGAIGGKFVLVGGTDDATHIIGVQRTTHVLEKVREDWTVRRMADYPGKPVAMAAAAVIGEELFVFGGMNSGPDGAAANSAEAFAFSPGRNSWRALLPLADATRGMTAIALDQQHIYLAGGFSDAFRAQAFLYDVTSDTYLPAKPLPYAALVTLLKSGVYLYCLGGEDRKRARTDKFFRIPVAALAGE